MPPPHQVWGAEAPGFESLGGLPGVVRSLREMALVPLLYPGLLAHLGVEAPRCGRVRVRVCVCVRVCACVRE